MTLPVMTSPAPRSFGTAAVTVAHVAVLLSPALCTASSLADVAQIRDLDNDEAGPIKTIPEAYTASHLAQFLEIEGLDEVTYINAIPEQYDARYDLLQPIPVDFEEVAPDAVIAHFREADLAVTGLDRQDAQDSLVSWILDIFDDLAEAEPQVLGVTPTMQIRVLRQHLERRR